MKEPRQTIAVTAPYCPFSPTDTKSWAVSGSGFLNKRQVETLAGVLGRAMKFLLAAPTQAAAFAAMGPDEDGEVWP